MTMTRVYRVGVCVLVFAVFGCARQERPFFVSTQVGPSIRVVEPPPVKVAGNTLTIPLEVAGIELLAADGDTSGKTGHFHVFLDREPVAVGEAIPNEPGIVHSAALPLRLYGLSVGDHRATIVLGDGTHRRIAEGAQAVVSFSVAGPSVRASAPAVVKAGAQTMLEVAVEGLTLAAPGAKSAHGGHGSMEHDSSDEASPAHLHYVVDPASPPSAGANLAAATAHSGETSFGLGGLSAGRHAVWVVAGTADHKALDPLVADRVEVVVEAA